MADHFQADNIGRPIKTGVAGLGRSGWGIHIQALAEMTDLFSIVAVCDPDEARQAQAQERFGCRVYDDCAGLIADDDVELVVVATPSQYHCTDSLAAMRAGKHVLVEKPMAPSLVEVDEMIAAARETGQILTVNQNYRYAPDFLKIKEVIDSGVLGRIIQIRLAAHRFSRRWDWQTLKAFGGGILNNQGAHMIDWALLLVDDPAPEVVAHMETTPLYAGDAESHVKVLLRPQNGPLIDIELTHANAFPQASCLVMGTQGSLISDRQLIRWRYFDPEEAPPLVLDTKPTPDRTYNSEDLPWQEASYQPDRNFLRDVRCLYQDLFMSIRHDAPLVISPESVRRQVAVLEQCRQAGPTESLSG
ncbi:MAG: Gfo/Idh/MocA family oxidoreductase [Chloroflexota bacterium]|nr:Gfo/Idh/MocA family oxidoreductase [Chloroflexota bacterium]